MKDENVKRESYWVVEMAQGEKVLYQNTFKNFESAWTKYESFKEKDIKGKASVMLQRRYKEYKIA